MPANKIKVYLIKKLKFSSLFILLSSSFSAFLVHFVTNNFPSTLLTCMHIDKIIKIIKNIYPPKILKNLLYIFNVTFPAT